ncbi:MAG: radical SAM protein [Myxococcales bacterium]|nr:MAG: radical SAM protein [Myxococcales bacterium]
MLSSYTLRISVLENCQLRCNYCDPPQKFSNQKLSLSSYQKLACALQTIPIEKIRFTGGEPLLRKELPSIVEIFSEYFPGSKRALTTNGLLFTKRAQSLWQAGLRHITFHLDSLNESRYANLMGKGSVASVLNAIEKAQAIGFETKLNMVVQQSNNDDELLDFLLMAKKYKLEVRFIELMNTGSAQDFVKENFLSGKKIIEKIKSYGEVIAMPRKHASDPAQQFYFSALNVNFGLIASDTQPFCENCNRLRLSASGKLYGCLYDSVGVDLLKEDEKKLEACIKQSVENKESFHPSLNKHRRRLFSMSQTGG